MTVAPTLAKLFTTCLRMELSGLVPIAPSDTILGHTGPEEAWQRQALPTQALLGLQGAAYPLFPSLSNSSRILVAKPAIVPILMILQRTRDRLSKALASYHRTR